MTKTSILTRRRGVHCTKRKGEVSGDGGEETGDSDVCGGIVEGV